MPARTDLNQNVILQNYYSGTDVIVYLSTYRLENLSYIQWSIKSGVVPVYNVFNPKPRLMLETNMLVHGQIGFNFKYAKYLKWLSDEDDSKVKVLSNGTIYVPQMKAIFNSSDDVTPMFIFNDVYISGGVKTAIPDGNPVQDIYSFVAMDIEEKDVLADDN